MSSTLECILLTGLNCWRSDIHQDWDLFGVKYRCGLLRGGWVMPLLSLEKKKNVTPHADPCRWVHDRISFHCPSTPTHVVIRSVPLMKLTVSQYYLWAWCQQPELFLYTMRICNLCGDIVIHSLIDKNLVRNWDKFGSAVFQVRHILNFAVI